MDSSGVRHAGFFSVLLIIVIISALGLSSCFLFDVTSP
jgi:hypothetical protein